MAPAWIEQRKTLPYLVKKLVAETRLILSFFFLLEALDKLVDNKL